LTNDYIVNKDDKDDKHHDQDASETNVLSENDLSEHHDSESIKEHVRHIVKRNSEQHSHQSPQNSLVNKNSEHIPIVNITNDVPDILMPNIENKINAIDDVPETQQPINQQSINQQPINQQPINQQPINQQPINQQPINQQPINQQPTNQQQLNEDINLFGVNDINQIGGTIENIPMPNDKIDKFFENFLN
jgi:hypothetical protein